MLDVFFTTDVEIWCDGWTDIDRKFANAFRQYIYGPTAKGNFGLPYQVEVLNAHGLTGVFFVESLFSARFGSDSLAEIVGMLNAGNQEVQLHVHTEWADEARQALLENNSVKRQHLRYFSLEEQTTLIGVALTLLHEAGAANINAFRAGSFAMDLNTMRALKANRILFDSSYNASMWGQDSGVMDGTAVVEPVFCEGVYEYPMTVFSDGTTKLRHAQITACSNLELEGLLWQSLDRGSLAFVLLSHNFELLNEKRNRPDGVAVKRFNKLCNFLDRNRDSFNVRGFHGLEPRVATRQPKPLASAAWKTAGRMVEQLGRRIYQ